MHNLFNSQHQLSWKLAGLLSMLSSRLFYSSPTSLESQIPSQCSAEEPALENSAGVSFTNTEEFARKYIYSYKHLRRAEGIVLKPFCTELLNTDLELTSNLPPTHHHCILCTFPNINSCMCKTSHSG